MVGYKNIAADDWQCNSSEWGRVSTMFIMELLFWFSIVTLLYTYLGFPLLVFCIGRLKNYQVEKKAITPTISLIIAAYNEEEGIAEKLENSLNLSYPVEALEIIVASDGS